MWAEMKMNPTDLADVSYTYTYLMNGQAPLKNWTGLFRPVKNTLTVYQRLGNDLFRYPYSPG
jgi:hypothetical protein